MTRIVLDSNVIISAIVFGGKPRAVLELVERGRVEMVISRDIRAEVEEVLRLKFRWPDERIRAACLPIWRVAINVTPKRTLAVADDPDDDRIIECAIEGKAQAIVTGDGDLLRLGAHSAVAILSPAAFLLIAS